MAVGHIECQPFVSQLVVEISAYLRYQKWISRFIRVSVVILNATAQIMIGRTINVGAPDKPCGVGRADANPKLLLNDT